MSDTNIQDLEPKGVQNDELHAVENGRVVSTEAVKEMPVKELQLNNSGKPHEKYMVDARETRTNYFDPVVWQQMKGMAEVFKNSGALGSSENASTLVMKIQAGYEMGMKPIESVKSFYFVNGVLNIFGAAVVRRLREHGWRIEYKDEENKCAATITKGDEIYSDTLTFDEAKQSGWVESYGKLKPGWMPGANRKLKLRYGVISMLIKTYIPEVLGSAVDIAEVAMDTVPLFEQSNNEKNSEIVSNSHDEDPITDSQRKTILALAAKHEIKVDNIDSMSQKTARAWIAGINQK